MQLRPYQEEVVSKIMWAKDLPGNDVVCVAQGGGKSLIIAETAHRLGNVLVMCPNKEILEQNVEKMEQYVDRSEIGVYSASMDEKTIRNITFGTIQSMYKHPKKFVDFDTIIIDECDLVNPKELKGMYQSFFNTINNMRGSASPIKCLGFTGTPFRQDVMYEKWGSQRWMVTSITTTKMIVRMKPLFWRRMLCVINTQDLVDQGYLTPLTYHDVNLFSHETIPTNKSKSDFDLETFEGMVEDKLQTIANFIVHLQHKAKLVFCATIKQAQALHHMIPGSVVVTSKTRKKERARIVHDMKTGNITVVLNVGIFTVGFDYPALDCIVLLRPTRSLRLHCQILGRVARSAEGKLVGHVYDFVENVKTLGKLADIQIKKDDTGKWNVMGGMYPQGFHNAPLYTYKLKKPQHNQESEL